MATARTNGGRDPLTAALLVLTIIGALNWGLIGFFNFNLVDAVFGGGAHEQTSAGSRVIYAIVGLAGLALIFLLPSLTNDRRLGATRTGRGPRTELPPRAV